MICAYQVGDLIIDPGPASCVETLLERLGPAKPRALLLTHIHLDHAGAAGVLCRRFPELQVYVHEVGAPHLVDPSKLLESAGRLYGDDMWELWGEVAPVPEERVHPLSGGEAVEDFRVAYTPGHASHHVAYLHEPTGTALVGDVAGARIPPSDFVIAPTVPPDIDVEAWDRSLDLVAGWDPATLALTHFGQVDDVGPHLDAMRASLHELTLLAAQHGFEAFAAGVRERMQAGAGELAPQLEQAVPVDQVYLGLRRYLDKRPAA